LRRSSAVSRRHRYQHRDIAINTANAVASGIGDFRWHVQRGTPIQMLKELGGWETMEMV
jgi:hypothetical protein